MNTEIYNEIVKATLAHFAPVWETDQTLNLEKVEKVAALLARPRSPKGTYIPDIALQVAFDVIGLSNNERIIRATFEGPGEFVKVAIGHTFTNEDNEEDQDVSDRLFFIEGEYSHDKMEKQIELLAIAIGETLDFIETLNVEAA